MKLIAQDIDRHAWSSLGVEAFRRDYLAPLRPVIVTDAIEHWPAARKWTPEFFRREHGTRLVRVDGAEWALDDLIDRIEASTPARPAPYLRNELLQHWPESLREDIAPMPECTQPNWLDSRAFPTRRSPTAVELYIGGAGAKFPILHYDNLHTHAFLMQVYGDKEYVVLAPDQTAFVYPRRGEESNKSQIDDVEQVDYAKFPLFREAQATRFRLRAGETLFVPAGWWHTARIVSTSITVSMNGVNAPNWRSFVRDYCAQAREASRVKSALLLPYLLGLGELLAIFE